MPKSDFVPPSDNDYVVWHDKLKAGVTAQQATFGLVAADVTALGNDNTDIHAKVTTVNSTAATAKQAVADKNTSRQGTEKRARALARRIKAHPAYTVALGKLLGIDGPEDTTDLTTAKADLSGTDQTGGVVELDFTKSKSDGVNIYSKRGAETDFTFLARDSSAPYVDNRQLLVPGKPELRLYKAVYVLNDAEIGLFSDEVVVNCAP